MDQNRTGGQFPRLKRIGPADRLQMEDGVRSQRHCSSRTWSSLLDLRTTRDAMTTRNLTGATGGQRSEVRYLSRSFSEILTVRFRMINHLQPPSTVNVQLKDEAAGTAWNQQLEGLGWKF